MVIMKWCHNPLDDQRRKVFVILGGKVHCGTGLTWASLHLRNYMYSHLWTRASKLTINSLGECVKTNLEKFTVQRIWNHVLKFPPKYLSQICQKKKKALKVSLHIIHCYWYKNYVHKVTKTVVKNELSRALSRSSLLANHYEITPTS
jgi:protein gp37